jgi:hypothetical protein
VTSMPRTSVVEPTFDRWAGKCLRSTTAPRGSNGLAALDELVLRDQRVRHREGQAQPAGATVVEPKASRRRRPWAIGGVVLAVAGVGIIIAMMSGGSAGVPPSGSSCPADHPVKGNDSSSGAKIYHEPGDTFYARTNPERCFEDASEAESAGYRASRS